MIRTKKMPLLKKIAILVMLALVALCEGAAMDKNYHKSFAAGIGCGIRSEIKTQLVEVKRPVEAPDCGYFMYDPAESKAML